MDLNLLRVFVAVFEAGSATGAAERLFVTQSAVSQSLARLRRELGDALFQREGRVLRPTPAAQNLYPHFHAALVRIESAVAGIRDFDPGTSTHRFRIALSELGEVGFLPAILTALAREAPSVTLDVISLDLDALPEWLARGKVDLAIASTPPPGDHPADVLKSEHYVLLMSQTNPIAQHERVSRAVFMGARHVVTSGDSAAPGVGGLLERANLRFTPDLVVNHFSSLPGLLHAGPWVAVVPSSLADNWVQTWPLVARALPIDLPPIQVQLYSRWTSHESSALRWFHDTVMTTVKGAPRQFWSPPPLASQVPS